MVRRGLIPHIEAMPTEASRMTLDGYTLPTTRLSDRSYAVAMSARDRLADIGDRCKLLVGDAWMNHPEYRDACRDYDLIMDAAIPEWSRVRRLARAHATRHPRPPPPPR